MSRKIVNGNPVPYMRGGVIYEHIYELTLYDESENANFEIVLHKVQVLYPKADICYIHHILDKLEDGTLKKPHWHLLIIFPRERSIKKLQADLEIPLNLIEWKAYLDKAVQYLIHLNNPEKAQYDAEDINGNWNYMQFLGGDFSSNYKSELATIIDFVDKYKEHITFRDIYVYCNEHNLLRTYKSWYNQIRDIYKE